VQPSRGVHRVTLMPTVLSLFNGFMGL